MSDHETLLIVDDNPVNLQLLYDFLTSSGYRVLVAQDGESALEQAAEAIPDLVLMDVLLPGMNGFDACRALHDQETTATIPVIFLTALSRTEDKIEGFQAGGVDYLTKPLQFEEVVARVRVHLELRRLRDELAERNRELEHHDRQRERLLSVIAHDLKSPMASFVNAIRDLNRIPPDDPDYQAVVVALGERAERMNHLVETLLDWGRLIMGAAAGPDGPVHLAGVVDDVVAYTAEQAGLKEIVVHRDVPDELTVRQNAAALQTVLLNLVTNAIKFTQPRGEIGVRATAADGRVEIDVWDTGVGMSEDDLEHVFGAEKRLRRRGTAGEQGTGIGLLLARDIVRQMDGTITARSEPDRGSTFTITIPG